MIPSGGNGPEAEPSAFVEEYAPPRAMKAPTIRATTARQFQPRA
jgi:hypothetical protein